VLTLADKFAKNLRARRGELTQEVFARKLGVSCVTLTRLENCAQNTTLKILNQIIKNLRWDVGGLFQ